MFVSSGAFFNDLKLETSHQNFCSKFPLDLDWCFECIIPSQIHIYIYSQKDRQCALSVITNPPMVPWQLMHLGTWCMVTHCWYQWTKHLYIIYICPQCIFVRSVHLNGYSYHPQLVTLPSRSHPEKLFEIFIFSPMIQAVPTGVLRQGVFSISDSERTNYTLKLNEDMYIKWFTNR